jgi:preprotein translocase SecF subunit
MFQLFKDPKYDFLGYRKVFLGISALVCAAGIWACFQIGNGKAPLGTDFGGGVLLHYGAQKDLEVEAIRGALKNAGYPEAQIQQVRTTGQSGFRLIVRIKRELTSEVGTTGGKVLSSLSAAFPEAGFKLEGSDEVGPVVSARLRDDAFKAFALAMVGILLYIAMRFAFRNGVISVFTTVHDILAIVAFVVLQGMEFDLLTVTAILTIAGYSLNDKVVIFDRIRDNLKIRMGDSYSGLVNLSLNETLNRTIVTGGSTLLALVPVYFLGGEVLHNFSLVLIFGIIAGTYSSIFVASPLLVEWQQSAAKRG